MPTLKLDLRIIRVACLTLFIFLSIFSTVMAQLPLEPKIGSLKKAEIVWPGVIDGNYQIFYSALDDDRIWSSKIQISSSNTLNLAPAIGAGNNGITWVVWSALEGINSQLNYCFYDGNTWSEPKEILSPLSSNTGPSILVDKAGIPWVVWSGFDGIDDDIYFSKWNGNDWAIPIKVNADNDVPDVLPRIALSTDNTLSVFWSGFDGDTYRQYVRNWDVNGWTVQKTISLKAYRTMVRIETGDMVNIPEFISEPDKASIHIRTAGGVSRSMSLREIN